jgi:[ribosomal protein S5]-alanine N-acetyltransferase
MNIKSKMEIVTRRFLLRDFVESDRLPFLKYQADPRNLTFYDPEQSSSDRAVHLFNLFQTRASEIPRINYQLAIIQKQEPYALIGCCGLRGQSLASGEMELGMELSPTYWGRYAYAIEVGQSLLDFGFRKLQLNVISGPTISANTKITRLVEWMGGEIVSIRPGSDWMRDRGWSEVNWRMTRSQWQDRKAGLKSAG